MEQKDKGFKKVLKLIVRIGLSLVAVYLIVTKVDLAKAWLYLTTATWQYLFLALLSFLASKIIAAFRINRFYRSQGLIISEKLNIKLNLLSMFYNLFIPLVGGEGYRAIWLKRNYQVKVKSIVSAALLDRASGLVALSFLTIVFFWFTPYSIPYKDFVFILIPVVYVSFWLLLRFFFPSFLPALRSTHILSFFVQALQAVTVYFVLLALHIDTLQVEYVFVFLLSTFAFVLPMMGAREMAFVFGAEYLGLDMEISLAISLLFYLSLALASLTGAYFVIFPKSLGEREKATA